MLLSAFICDEKSLTALFLPQMYADEKRSLYTKSCYNVFKWCSNELHSNIRLGDEKFNGLLRVPFARTGDSLRIITVYWTSRIEKYWEGKSEDKI
jgi:hypothetical protein